MNFTSYFIKHPVIAIILNIMIIVTGLLCFDSLSVREYPDIEFPSISVETYYPNASAELIENSVTNILEESLAGITGVETITSQSQFANSSIYLKFNSNIKLDQAINDVREATHAARHRLPLEAQEPAIRKQGTRKLVTFYYAHP